MDDTEIKYFVEAALLAAGRPLTIEQLQKLFDTDSAPERAQIRGAIDALADDYLHRGLRINEVASGYRIEIRANMADRLQKLWEERPPRYSRALFETLALVAYRQPITRGEIEEIRGVSVSTNIIRTLLEREWVRVVGHRDVPGRPAMFGTTRQFLDYFGLKKLDDLPPLADLSDWESLRVQLNLPAVDENEADEQHAGESGDTAVPMLHAERRSSAVPKDDDTKVGEEEVLPELTPLDDTSGEFGEELVVSEWPDPAEADEVSIERPGKTDKDASAGRG